MTVRAPDRRYRPLWVGGAGLVLLPIVLRAVGLTYDAATLVVILAMAAMSLNLLVGYTGLVSFGHSAWFGIGAFGAVAIRFGAGAGGGAPVAASALDMGRLDSSRCACPLASGAAGG